MLRSKLTLQFVFLFLIGAGIFTGVRLVQERQEVREEAAVQPSLYIRNDKSYVKPGESYTLIVLADYKNWEAYNGNLEVGSNCDSSGNSCTNVSLWKNFDGSVINVQNGGITITIPSNSGPFSASDVRFRPSPNPNNYRWSNPITMGVDETTSLMDTTKYMVMPSKPILYRGVNSSYENESPTNFEMVIGFDEFANRLGGEDLKCGGPAGKVMYFIKSDPKAYWNPQTPWFDYLRREYDPQHNYAKENLLWPLNYWRQPSSWYDNFITATGDVKYNLQPDRPLTKENNFKTKRTQHRYGSSHPALPHYFLTAKYVGNGWGLGNPNTYLVGAGNTPEFCKLSLSGTGNKAWTVHADKASISGYSDVLRLKYYEADSGFIKDRSRYALREDWYWAKGVGLVKIEVKNFCPNDYSKWGGPYSNCIPCFDDPDCLNDKMSNPQIVLNRVGDYIPTPPPPPNCSIPNPNMTATCNSNYKNDLRCTWGGVSNATEYQGQIDNNSDFSSPIVDSLGSGTSRSTGNVTANRTYYCRSRVTKSNGSCTIDNKWSSVDTVKKACPTPIPTVTNTPTPTVTNTPTPTLTSTPTPTKKPTATPTKKPSATPTKKPTITPIVTSTPTSVPGDATGEGVVDIEDYKVWINNYNTSTQGGSNNADFDDNGRVDGKDYIIWLTNYMK
jgi:hypothetical protein